LLVGPLRRAAELDPLNEIVQATLVTTLAAAGHRAEALTAYRSIRGRLADELGIEPGPDLKDAYRQVMNETVPAPGPQRGSLVIVLNGLLHEDLTELSAFLSARRLDAHCACCPDAG
jgi:DNA-binding SARP family transcriptional activator